MKRNALLPIALIAVALFLGSCSTTYDATPTIPGKEKIRNPFQGDFTAMLNDENFTANTKYVYDTSTNDIRLLAISGQQYNYNRDTTRYKTISFSIFDYKGPKTYFLNQGISGVYSNIDSNITYNFSTVSAANDTLSSITVTSDQARYIGTFNLMVVQPAVGVGIPDTIYISSGQFDIPK